MSKVKPRVFVTRKLPGPALEMLGRECEVEVWPEDSPPPPDILRDKVAGTQGILCLLTDRVDGDLLDAAGPDLKVVSNYAVGFDNIDVAAASSRGIPVGNTPGVLTETTADLAFALLMAGARRIVDGAKFAAAGLWESWSPTLLLGADVHAATLGILGLGRIGNSVARRARGFDMEVLYYHPSASPGRLVENARAVELDELFGRADFLSIHVPLKPETHHLIGEQALGKMKDTAVLINTARGPIVDHDALYRGLRDGQIAYAALDVTDPEPLPRSHPLYDLENCLIIPHLGSASVSTRSKMGVMAAENLLAGLAGEPLPHCVNPQVSCVST